MAFEDGKMIRITTSSSYVRRSPGTNEPYIGCFYQGNMFLCAGASNNWVKIYWGNRDKRDFAYISQDNVEELSFNTSNALLPVMNMALSFAQNGGSIIGKEIEGGDLELGGEWCQTFLYWLCNASGLYGSENFPHFDDALCKEGMQFFDARRLYHPYNEAGFEPRMGDWVYYKLKSAPDGEVSHVGLVNAFYNNKLHTVEGNWGSPRCVRICNDAVAEHSNYEILGFARPTYA